MSGLPAALGRRSLRAGPSVLRSSAIATTSFASAARPSPIAAAGVAAAVSRRGLATPTNSSAPITWTEAPASQPATLHLKSGHTFTGQSFGAQRSVFGETVFSTAITSYTESLTDPSYQGQFLTFTQPLIGNYGVPDNFAGRSPVGHEKDVDVGAFMESRGVQAAGVICSNLAERFSHFEARESLATWCARHNVPGISGIDTRALTTLLRNQGSTLGAIKVGPGHEIPPNQDDFVDPMAENLIARVSTRNPYVIHPKCGAEAARGHVALLDFGSKANILRCLLREGVSVTVLPWDYDFNAHRDNFDGLFLSNGPGSPYSIPEAVETTKKALKDWARPIFGICMGNQIIGIAAGIRAYRMKFGNRGHNQPVISLSTVGKNTKAGRVYITSQNHGYCLDYDHDQPNGGWPQGWIPWFVNANDGTIEGLRAAPETGRLIWATQSHPESSGGPLDTNGMFVDFVDEVEADRKRRGDAPGKGLPESEIGQMPTGFTKAAQDFVPEVRA